MKYLCTVRRFLHYNRGRRNKLFIAEEYGFPSFGRVVHSFLGYWDVANIDHINILYVRLSRATNFFFSHNEKLILYTSAYSTVVRMFGKDKRKIINLINNTGSVLVTL
jgi:hypothetical protein